MASSQIPEDRLDSPEKETFRDSFDYFFPRLRSFFKACGFSSEDAEDLSQTTLWNVYRAEGQFRGEGSREGWIYAAARNAARDEWRRRGRLPERDEKADPADGRPAAEVSAASREELARTVNDLLKIPARMRACLLLRVQEGLSYQEIGRRLSLSPYTVKVQIWNARRRLKAAREADA